MRTQAGAESPAAAPRPQCPAKGSSTCGVRTAHAAARDEVGQRARRLDAKAARHARPCAARRMRCRRVSRSPGGRGTGGYSTPCLVSQPSHRPERIASDRKSAAIAGQGKAAMNHEIGMRAREIVVCSECSGPVPSAEAAMTKPDGDSTFDSTSQSRGARA